MSSVFYSFPLDNDDPREFRFYLIVRIVAIASFCSPRRVVTIYNLKNISHSYYQRKKDSTKLYASICGFFLWSRMLRNLKGTT